MHSNMTVLLKIAMFITLLILRKVGFIALVYYSNKIGVVGTAADNPRLSDLSQTVPP